MSDIIIQDEDLDPINERFKNLTTQTYSEYLLSEGCDMEDKFYLED